MIKQSRISLGNCFQPVACFPIFSISLMATGNNNLFLFISLVIIIVLQYVGKRSLGKGGVGEEEENLI